MTITDLTLDELNVILLGLGELPAKQSINLIIKIQQQAQAQIKAKEDNKASENESQES